MQNRLRELRTRAGLTLRELGAATHTHYSRLSRAERGLEGLREPAKRRLASYFNVSVADLFHASDAHQGEQGER